MSWRTLRAAREDDLRFLKIVREERDVWLLLRMLEAEHVEWRRVALARALERLAGEGAG